ncbi:hypothetical protein GC163_09465 [bacterium]|nr:hypothetical protein [bacterium]
MGVPFLVIDGYNLLHAAGLARLRYGPGDLERARHRLLAMLCEKLDVAEQIRCTVVFDAQNSPIDSVREVRHQELRVIYAPVGTDADSEIEEIIAHHSAPKQMIVVSSDHRLHKAARRRGALPTDSEPFWERLRKRADVRTALVDDATPTKPTSKPATVNPVTAQWLAIFGEVSVNEIAAEVRAEDPAAKAATDWSRHLESLQQELEQPGGLERLIDEPRRSAPRKGPQRG